MSKNSNLTLGLVLGCLIVSCCAVIFVAGAMLFLSMRQEVARFFSRPQSQVEFTPVVIRPTPIPARSTPDAFSPQTSTSSLPIPLVTTETLLTLENSSSPAVDPIELAKRFHDIDVIDVTVPALADPLQVGEVTNFWLSNATTNQSFQVSAKLEYIGEHVYFWVEDGVDFALSDVKNLVDIFDRQIYPTNREFFGSEWSPGIDNDPRIYILYVRNMGDGIAGYFSSTDELPPEANPYSNSHEMFDVNADTVGLDEKFTLNVLAHEFQHMIHWYRDRNEETWVSEGFSELAAFLNGFYDSGFDQLFSTNPDIQLNTWPDSTDGDSTPHYGSSFLFMAYFLDRFGESASKALVAHQENGLTSIDQTFANLDIQDPLTNKTMTADNLFLDWVITNYINDDRVGDGRFAYQRYTQAPEFGPTQEFQDCPVNPQVNTVHQYGADYIRFVCEGDFHLNFEGSIQTEVVPASPHSGNYMWWSNRNDESDMTLTQTFDFSAQTGSLTLDYWTWYDIEDGYDFTYLTVSEDGEHWVTLETHSGTNYNPGGRNYGWGYTGKSGGGQKPAWVHEVVDLSSYAGKRIQVRFEYVTDGAVNRNGFLLDDLSIPEIGYTVDFEQGNGGWESAGWARIHNILPQTWKLALIRSTGQDWSVEYLDLKPDLSLDLPIRFGDGVESVTLVVTATTRFTTQPASYRYWLRK